MPCLWPKRYDVCSKRDRLLCIGHSGTSAVVNIKSAGEYDEIVTNGEVGTCMAQSTTFASAWCRSLPHVQVETTWQLLTSLQLGAGHVSGHDIGTPLMTDGYAALSITVTAYWLMSSASIWQGSNCKMRAGSMVPHVPAFAACC